LSVSLKIEKLSKKYGSSRVLKDVELSISPFEKIAILGQNGSGKSTLLKLMAGFVHFEKGSIEWTNEAKNSIIDQPQYSISSPYLELFEHLTVDEQLQFHFKQRDLIDNISLSEIYALANLESHKNKYIRQLSSGIKQRFKNALAIFTKADVLFLDEPCSNLDEENITLYQTLMLEYAKNKMVIIASNHKPEYEFICTKEFKIEEKALKLLSNKQLWA